MTQEPAPQFLMIVRERLRPGMEQAYSENEVELATACATLNCPHPYLALASTTGPREVWWFNAFASKAECDRLESAYARNEALMAALSPLGRRKEYFRETVGTMLTAYRAHLSGGATLRLAGARFVVVSGDRIAPTETGAVFESSDRERFFMRSASDRETAEQAALRAGPGSVLLAVQPQWSFPAEAWIAADREFWSAGPVAHNMWPPR